MPGSFWVPWTEDAAEEDETCERTGDPLALWGGVVLEADRTGEEMAAGTGVGAGAGTEVRTGEGVGEGEGTAEAEASAGMRAARAELRGGVLVRPGREGGGVEGDSTTEDKIGVPLLVGVGAGAW